jgi:hypothetical protein
LKAGQRGAAVPALRPWTSLAPPLAALLYPFVLKVFTVGATASGGGFHLLAAIALLVAIALPFTGVYVALGLGAMAQLHSGQLIARRIALLSVAAPPQFVTIGVIFYMLKPPFSDVALWVVFWSAATAACALTLLRPGTAVQNPVRLAAPALRVSHGIAAALILLLFLGMHLSNHLAGIISVAEHRQVMDVLRKVYRKPLVEPVVVGLFLFQVSSGAALLWHYSRAPADAFRSLQIASGAYLVFFILGHMDSVFIYARGYAGIPTDWDFAVGAPTGLIKDAWNIRLLPHYLLGVFFVLTHLFLGARGVALAHGVERRLADRAALAGAVAGAGIAVIILTGMSGLHLAQ